ADRARRGQRHHGPGLRDQRGHRRAAAIRPSEAPGSRSDRPGGRPLCPALPWRRWDGDSCPRGRWRCGRAWRPERLPGALHDGGLARDGAPRQAVACPDLPAEDLMSTVSEARGTTSVKAQVGWNPIPTARDVSVDELLRYAAPQPHLSDLVNADR